MSREIRTVSGTFICNAIRACSLFPGARYRFHDIACDANAEKKSKYNYLIHVYILIDGKSINCKYFPTKLNSSWSSLNVFQFNDIQLYGII